MEKLRMPASYATLPEEELPEISISFVPLLLFNVVVSGYRFVENIYKNLSNWFGYHDDTFSAVSSFTDEMRQKQQQRGI